MGRGTDIQWCDDTVNPTMGCDGCELWNAKTKICYAGQLHQRYGGKNKGFSPVFEKLTFHPGRMAKAASAPDLRCKDRPGKPWLNGMPRLIFVSDMSDALSKDVPFDFLETEIIDVVNSEKGKRHHWLWLTKRPSVMQEFDHYLENHGISWPDNLWAGTSITTQATAKRIEPLLQVRAKIRFVSVEPQWEQIDLSRIELPAAYELNPLRGQIRGTITRDIKSAEKIHWVIGGGQSGTDAVEYDLAWARFLIKQLSDAKVPYFQKQLGARPVTTAADMDVVIPGLVQPESKAYLRLEDGHGGEMSEWPEDLRVRQFPKGVE